jgi:hypothetical protein
MIQFEIQKLFFLYVVNDNNKIGQSINELSY